MYNVLQSAAEIGAMPKGPINNIKKKIMENKILEIANNFRYCTFTWAIADEFLGIVKPYSNNNNLSEKYKVTSYSHNFSISFTDTVNGIQFDQEISVPCNSKVYLLRSSSSSDDINKITKLDNDDNSYKQYCESHIMNCIGDSLVCICKILIGGSKS